MAQKQKRYNQREFVNIQNYTEQYSEKKYFFLLYKKAKDTEDRHQKYKTSQYSRGEKNGL